MYSLSSKYLQYFEYYLMFLILTFVTPILTINLIVPLYIEYFVEVILTFMKRVYKVLNELHKVSLSWMYHLERK